MNFRQVLTLSIMMLQLNVLIANADTCSNSIKSFLDSWKDLGREKLNAEDFITKSTLKNLEETFGEVRPEVGQGSLLVSFFLLKARLMLERPEEDGDFNIEDNIVFELKSKRNIFVHCALFRHQTIPNLVEISDLTIEVPKRGSNIRQTQSAKGLGLEDIIQMKKGLFQLLKNHQVKTLVTTGPSDYQVSALYRRFLGLKPANESIKINYERLDNLYKDYLNFYPESHGIKTLDRFSTILGNSETSDKNWVANIAEKKLKDKSEDYKSQIVEIKNDRGLTFAIRYQYSAIGTYEFFVDYTGKPILWDTLLKKGKLKLQYEFF